MLGHERLLKIDNFIGSKVRVEVGLDRVEDHDGAIGTSTAGVRAPISIQKSEA